MRHFCTLSSQEEWPTIGCAVSSWLETDCHPIIPSPGIHSTETILFFPLFPIRAVPRREEEAGSAVEPGDCGGGDMPPDRSGSDIFGTGCLPGVWPCEEEACGMERWLIG